MNWLCLFGGWGGGGVGSSKFFYPLNATGAGLGMSRMT